MKVITLNSLPDSNKVSTITAVFSQYTAGVNILKDFKGGVQALMGKRTASYETDIQKARDVVLANLKQKTNDLGGNALLGVQFQYSQLTDTNITLITVCGSGTAAIISES